MPFDSLTLTAVKNELNQSIIDARLEKIYMPASNILVFNFHGKNGRQKLLIALDNYARIHLTQQNFDNPLNAPAFCMHLRKYLNGAKLVNITQPKYERILEFEFNVLNELRDNVSFKVIAEIMGKYSNVIAVNENGIITECIKHIYPNITSTDTIAKRALLPNIAYTYPETEGKITIDDYEEFISRLMQFTGGALDKYIMGFLKGIAPSTVSELVSDIIPELIDEEVSKIIYKRFYDYADKVKKGDIFPVVTFSNDGEPDDYYLFPQKINSNRSVSFDSINQAIDSCMSQKTSISSFKVKYNELFQILKSLASKAEKRRVSAETKLRESASAEKYKLYGELILSNLHNIKSRTDKVELFNYYDNTNITVPLDIKLTPQANAQKYYKKYNKSKKTAEVVTQQINEDNEFIEYIQTIIESLRQAETLQDLEDIAAEMKQNGFIKDNTKKSEKEISKPRQYKVDGFLIRVGRNNAQNDRLVRASKPDDIWLHTKDIHSSHTVITSDKKVVPNHVLVIAAEITAYYSKAHLSQNVPVDYTFIKFVKKPPKAALGRVIYTDQHTLFVNPQKRDEYRIKN